MKKFNVVFAVLLIIALCFSIMGCGKSAGQSEEEIQASIAAEESRQAALEASRAAEEAAQAAAAEESRLAAEAAKREETINQIIDVLEWVPAVDGLSLSLSSAIAGTFHNYKWDFKPYNNKDSVYIVTFAGNYSPNPRDLPQLSQSGTVSFLVDVKNYTASVYSDPNDICSAFILLALPW